ncbi:helix-turn-helix domain-containing protein [Bacteroides reticulotermitis]|uniref:Transcriptional regulator n=2 Tax=Bacteroides reticulotermitis TaxID=1133319 RepID=W4UXD3_9BACE|nr:helix-turn-helix domain-containing protein [Bacteroides reticulotermitis]MBB4042762.1 YesN/AraC family two-component response regulator [Bacteroides reticulotermitis]GAE85268.1 transcriptional regulator [Bacteroides reticulotermitis JCM 10512]HJD76150.1 helix-turn-helix domain-containing protein [Bacteroides reticulotermitis]
MANVIKKFDWKKQVEELAGVDHIGDDVFLLDKPFLSPLPNYPFKINVLSALICTKGVTRGKINLKPYTAEAPCMILMLPEQILEYEYVSEDFDGYVIVMSKQFLSSLEIKENFSAYLSVTKQPYTPLNEREMDAMLSYYTMLQRVIRAVSNINRFEIAKHLTIAFFYGIGPSLHNLSEKPTNRSEMLLEDFLKLVRTNYKEQRGLDFYADKLCLTPKYMSSVVKQASGISAGEWIDRYIILEAKALLKSTNMTIQQIGDEFNFANQSFFGKYFKRLVGVSPKEYRNN